MSDCEFYFCDEEDSWEDSENEFDDNEIWIAQYETSFEVGYRDFVTGGDFNTKLEASSKEYGITVEVNYPKVKLVNKSDNRVLKFGFYYVPLSKHNIQKRSYPFNGKKCYEPFNIDEVKIIKRDDQYEFIYRNFSRMTQYEDGEGEEPYATIVIRNNDKYETIYRNCDEVRELHMHEHLEEYGIEVIFVKGMYFAIYDFNEEKAYEVPVEKAIIPVKRVKKARGQGEPIRVRSLLRGCAPDVA